MKQILLIFFVLLQFEKSYTQTVAYPTPNAAAIGIFMQYPQIQCTGVPSINIPLYDFTYEGLSLPIALNYNSNLVKPNSFSSWVGIGWNLTVGGVINRVVNGSPDDLTWLDNIKYMATNDRSVGFYYNYNYLQDIEWISSSRIKDAITDATKYVSDKQKYSVCTTIRDYSPDEFSFSVGDISGFFYLDDHRNWKVRSKDKIIVEVNENDFTEVETPPYKGHFGNPDINFPTRKYLSKITLIDGRGIKYIFGASPNSKEMVDGLALVKTWYLSNVIFPNGKIIYFNYEKGSDVSSLYPSSYSFNSGVRYDTRSILAVYLKDIQTENQQITFFRSERTGELAKLDSVIINSKTGSGKFKRFMFGYSGTPKDRLKLSSFVQKDNNDQAIYKYSLLYDSRTFVSNRTDHWGYYNSKTYQSSNYSSFFESRDADTLNCRAELLKQVIYPTGGYTEYTWEPHDYSKAVADARSTGLIDYDIKKYAGGVRIKQITSFDQNGNKLDEKKYSYVNDFSPLNSGNGSSGILYAKPSYSYYSGLLYYFLPSIPLCDNNRGSHVSYSEVTEINADGSYTKTDFSNFDNGINNEYMDEAALNNTSYPPALLTPEYISNSHERGFPLRQRTYTASTKLLSESVFDYERFNKSNEFVKSYIGAVWSDGSDWQSGLAWWGSAIKIYTNPYLLKKETDILYDINGLNPVTTVKSYVYDDYRQVKNIETTRSEGDTRLKEYLYPYNFTNQQIYQEMIARNMWSAVIEQDDYKIEGGSRNFLSSSHTDYGFWNSDNQIYPLKKISRKGNGPATVLQQFYGYDSNGNVLSESRENGPRQCYVWGYSGQYPVAIAENAQSEEVAVANFEDQTDNFPVSGTVKDWTLPAVDQITFRSWFSPDSYTGLNSCKAPLLNSKTLPSGTYKLLFFAKGSGTLTINGIQKTVSDSWKYYKIILSDITGITINNPGSVLIDDLSLIPVNAEISTSTYKPLVGMTSLIDPSGQTTFYEYDNLNRLSAVRDRNRNLVKSYCYNYYNQVINCEGTGNFKNEEISVSVERNNCVTGYAPGPETEYTVPEGKYASKLSQADANQKARADIDENSQLYANTTCKCYKVIYARLEVVPTRAVLLEGDVDESLYEYRGDLVVHFYKDAQKNQPVNVTDIELDVYLHVDQEAGIYPPIGTPFILRCEGTSEVMLSDIAFKEEFAQRNPQTGEFQVINVKNYQHHLIPSPRYIIEN